MRSGHVEIFLDESGDLGFSFPASSRYLVTATLVTGDSEKLARIGKRTRARYPRRRDPRHELKFGKELDDVRRYVLQGVAAVGPAIVWGGLDKWTSALAKDRDAMAIYDRLCLRVIAETLRRVPMRPIDLVLDSRRARGRQTQEFSRLVDAVAERMHSGYFTPS